MVDRGTEVGPVSGWGKEKGKVVTSVMVCDCGRRCEESMTMYSQGMEREHDGVRLRM